MPAVMTTVPVTAIVASHMAPTHHTLRELREAVRALSDNPGPETVDRYLAASRALDPAHVARRRRSAKVLAHSS
jgi:hypothetical protein